MYVLRPVSVSQWPFASGVLDALTSFARFPAGFFSLSTPACASTSASSTVSSHEIPRVVTALPTYHLKEASAALMPYLQSSDLLNEVAVNGKLLYTLLFKRMHTFDNFDSWPWWCRVYWLHVTLLLGTPALALYGLIYAPPTEWSVRRNTLIWSGICYFISGMGITAGELTHKHEYQFLLLRSADHEGWPPVYSCVCMCVGYHRLWSHRSYSVVPAVHWVLSFCGEHCGLRLSVSRCSFLLPAKGRWLYRAALSGGAVATAHTTASLTLIGYSVIYASALTAR